MKKLSPQNVQEKLSNEHNSVCFVDVRSQDEFKSGHVPGATCVPLDEIEQGTALLPKDKLVILSCQSGKRSARAQEILRSRGYENIVEMEGGFSAWAGNGLPVNRLRNSIPIIRQVMITAGILILSGIILGFTIDPRFYILPAVMGIGLTFAGITGWCGMAFLLERMPWNRIS